MLNTKVLSMVNTMNNTETTNMTTQELNKALTTYANTDIRNARKHNEILLGGVKTDTGNATLSYDGETYSLTTFSFESMGSAVLASGKPAAIRPVLVSLYKVEFA
tara:strand:+ start:964 stop:1278 length:315 start_codon:yes stop_codon:yes gene_type:complete